MRRKPKRKAAPEWGIITELMLMILEPGYRVDESRAGIGHHPREGLKKGESFDTFVRFLRCIRRTGRCPLQWHRAKSFASKKPNGKKGPAGIRVMHCFDPWRSRGRQR